MNEQNNSSNNNVIFVFLFLIIIGLILFIFYDKGLFSKKDTINNDSEQSETTNNVSNSKSEEESIKYDGDIITDQTIKQDLSIKVSKILTFGNDTTSNASIVDTYKNSYFFDENKSYIENIEAAKLYIALNIEGSITVEDNGNSKFQSLTQAEIDSLPSKYDNYDKETMKKIDANTIRNNYYELFGEYPIDGDIAGCPGYTYDSEKALYYRYSACGGTAYPIVLFHKDRYVKNNDKIEVYISVATYRPVDETGPSNRIYKGIGEFTDSNYLYTKDLYNQSTNEWEYEKEIDNNYSKFGEQYKMTFKLTNNGYVYESIEKI